MGLCCLQGLMKRGAGDTREEESFIKVQLQQEGPQVHHGKIPAGTGMDMSSTCPAISSCRTAVPASSLGLQEDAVPALMTLKRALRLLVLMASLQQEITWFLGFPTEDRNNRHETGGDKSRCLHGNLLGCLLSLCVVDPCPAPPPVLEDPPRSLPVRWMAWLTALRQASRALWLLERILYSLIRSRFRWYSSL